MIVASVCGSALLLVFATSLFRYKIFSNKSPSEVAATQFAVERAQILDPNIETTCKQGLLHRMRHDVPCGGIW